MFNEIKALLLDCDGVIVDSERFNFSCWETAIKEIMKDASLTDLDPGSIIGVPLSDIFSLFETHLNARFSEAERRQILKDKNRFYFLNGQSELKPVEGIEIILERARNREWNIHVVSSGIRERLEFSLRTVGLLDKFDRVFFCEPGETKDYRKVLREINLSPHEVIAIEDSPFGVLAARGAGIKVIVAITTYFPRGQLMKLCPYLIINNYREVDFDRLSHRNERF